MHFIWTLEWMLRGDKDHITFSGKDLTRLGWVENEKCGNVECGVRSLESEECGEKKRNEKTKKKQKISKEKKKQNSMRAALVWIKCLIEQSVSIFCTKKNNELFYSLCCYMLLYSIGSYKVH